MNQFRIAAHNSDYDGESYDIVCLNCKTGLTCCNHPTKEKWVSCPVCRTIWEGEFVKRRKKYKVVESYDWRNPGYKTDPKTGELVYSDKPRIIIETRKLTNQKLSDDCFCPVTTTVCFTKWNLYSHTTSGWSKETSAYVDMFNRFKQYKAKPGEEVRLRLLIKDRSRIIATKENIISYLPANKLLLPNNHIHGCSC